MTDEHRFSESDLEPSPDERSAARRALVDRVAASIAVLAAGAPMGGMIALGACAAPSVFRLTPAPFSGDAMGTAFARFDQFALGAVVILLGAEVARTWIARRHSRALPIRIRRILSIFLAACTAYIALSLTPQINDLHRNGVRRGEGSDGIVLERIHQRAELLGKINVILGAAVVVLHVFTLASRRPEDDEEDESEALAPLPPGPRD